MRKAFASVEILIVILIITVVGVAAFVINRKVELSVISQPIPTSITVSEECLDAPRELLPNVNTDLKCYYIINIDELPKEEIKITVTSLNDEATINTSNFINQNGGKVIASSSYLVDAIVPLELIDEISSLEYVTLVERPRGPIVL